MVDAFIKLDTENGSPISSRYLPNMKLDCIIAMDEFSEGIDEQRFIEAIGGKNLNTDRMPTKRIY